MPVPPRNFVETATWELLGKVPEERQSVDGKLARGKKDVELIRCLIGDTN